jgi:small subunit ribosomal protein S9
MANQSKVYHAVGKRKTSIARVYMQAGQGQITINGRSAEVYFPKLYRESLNLPMTISGSKANFDVRINVMGGGSASQADACKFGISKALVLHDASNRPALKKAMLLTRDSRVVERKKYGHKKARKSFQFSKR